MGIAREQEEVVEASLPALAIDDSPFLGDGDGAKEESSNGGAFPPSGKIGLPGIRWVDVVAQLEHIDQRAAGAVDRKLECEGEFEGVAERV